MSIVSLPEFDELSAEAQQRWRDEDAAHGITHMKRTLLHSLPAFDALMTWYPLRDALVPYIGERGTIIVSYAISTTNECLICSLYFRRALAARGEDVSGVPLSDDEKDLERFGREVAAHGEASRAVTERLKARLGEDGLVLLVAFAGIMVATNIVNNALDIDAGESILALFEGEQDAFAGFGPAAARAVASEGSSK